MTDEAVRLSKRLAALVPCSRAEAERYIEGGWVRVDGVVVDEPQERVRPHQSVSLEPGASLLGLAPLTVLLHQVPGGVELPIALDRRWTADPGPRVTRTQLRQLQPLMPLPAGAGGLAVFSQDRRVLRKLTEEANLVEQELLVDVDGQIADGGLARLSHGLVRHGQPMPPIRASWQSERRLRLATKQLDPVHVPWMCAQVGLQVVQLRRLRLGRLALAGLPAGQWRSLLPHERF